MVLSYHVEHLDAGKNKDYNTSYLSLIIINIEGSEEMEKKKFGVSGFLLLGIIVFFLCSPQVTYADNKKATSSASLSKGKVTEIQVNAPQLKIIEGTSQQLYYRVVPTNALNTKVTFSTSDKKVLSVDSKGIMKGLMPGRAIITIASTDGSGVRTRVVVDVAKKISKVKNIAHRGIVTEAPENTMEAFRAAAEKGFWGIEFDVQSTKDHQFVVMHDADLARMTNGTGYIKDYTRRELRRYKIDSGAKLEELPIQRIPDLAQVLKLCQNYNVVPVIELKEVQLMELQGLLELLQKYDMEDKAIVISFKLELLEWLRKNSEELTLQWIEKKMSTEHINQCSLLNIDIDTKFYGLTKAKVDYAHSKNVLVNCWTILTEKDYRRMQSLGVDFITMDIIPPTS